MSSQELSRSVGVVKAQRGSRLDCFLDSVSLCKQIDFVYSSMNPKDALLERMLDLQFLLFLSFVNSTKPFKKCNNISVDKH